MSAPRPSEEARPPRPGDEIDPARLASWLAPFVGGLSQPLEILQFPAGHSNLTYLVRAGEREWVLRRPPPGAARIARGHDVGREYRILCALHPTLGRVPRPVAECDDPAVIGAPFYVMERLVGLIARGPAPAFLRDDPALCARLGTTLAHLLADLHGFDWQTAGLGALGHPEGYVPRQIKGWIARYEKARTDDLPGIEHAIRFLQDEPHPEGTAALVHNDFKHDNVVLDLDDPARVVGVLDWELATIGDPLLDLGTTLAYWLDPDDPPAVRRALALLPTTLPGTPDRAAFVAAYAARRGIEPPDLLLPYVFGLLKVATIGQQIYGRFAAGLTTDPRFGALIHAVRALGDLAVRAVERGRIDRLG